MKRLALNKMTYLISRIILFGLILTLGTLTALRMGETASLTSAALPQTAVEALAADAGDQVWYAGLIRPDQATQLYLTKDRGQHWQAIGTGLAEVRITDLVVQPADSNVLYAGTKGGDLETSTDLLLSTDGGQTWQEFPLKLPANSERQLPDVTVLAVDPNRPAALYVGTAGQGVYVYDVQPDSYGYELVGGVQLTQRFIQDLVVGPHSQVYALTTAGLIVIDRLHDTWHEITTLPDVAVSLAVDPDNAQVLYVGTAAYGAYHSLDGGRRWEALDNEALGWQPGVILRISALSIDNANPQHLVLATAYGVGSHLTGGSIYDSPNAGQSWTKLADTPTVVTSLHISSGGVYAATDQGLVQVRQPTNGPAASPLDRLATLSVSQILILILTISLAGLSLIGRIEWDLRSFGSLAHSPR